MIDVNLMTNSELKEAVKKATADYKKAQKIIQENINIMECSDTDYLMCVNELKKRGLIMDSTINNKNDE